VTVSPGFDNTPLSNDPITPFYGKKPEVVDRAQGAFYQKVWAAAAESEPMWVFITTWNEWQENTSIEPSQLYGNTYLDLTRLAIQRWKNP